MGYFRELPDILYQSQSSDRNSSRDYIRVKNLFRRVKLRDDLQNIFTVFNKYQITEGERPDTVAEKLYGSSSYDWVVLLTAGIINVYDQWPLSDRDLYQYAENKYGNDLTAVRFYETTEVKDSSGRLILPKGKVVDSDFTFFYSDVGKNCYSNSLSRISYTQISSENTPVNSSVIKVNLSKNNVNTGDELLINGIYIPVVSSTNDTTNNVRIITLFSPISIGISQGSTLTFKLKNTILIEKNPVTGISNYEYEVIENEKKRSIYILKPIYLQQVINDTRKAMTYDKSSQYVDNRLIRTENTKASNPF